MYPTQRNSETAPIRRLDLSSDLDQVADLIEMCFPISSDPDGQNYIKEMRKAARDMRMLGWLSNLAEMGSTKSAGFVWEESGKIYGNLSLIPFQNDGCRIHLIANVAVHPDHQRQGIARALTQHALAYLRWRKDPAAWLQVRADNEAAIALYRSSGFKEKAVRTTWRIRPMDVKSKHVHHHGDISVVRRNQETWRKQQTWLAEAYPNEIRWNLPVDFSRFAPGLFQKMNNFMDGIHLRHWAFSLKPELQGVVTWQKTRAFSNNIWLAFPTEKEAKALPAALSHVLQRLEQKHPLSIDYPQGRSIEDFEDLGFEKFRTLIWMQCTLR